MIYQKIFKIELFPFCQTIIFQIKNSFSPSLELLEDNTDNDTIVILATAEKRENNFTICQEKSKAYCF